MLPNFSKQFLLIIGMAFELEVDRSMPAVHRIPAQRCPHPCMLAAHFRRDPTCNVADLTRSSTCRQGAQGFLRKADHEAACGEGSSLQAGMLVETVVRSVKDPRNISVSTSPAEVASTVTKEWDGLNQESLLPGALVNARIRNVLSDGLLVSFLTYFHGTVDQFHLATPLPKLQWRQVRGGLPGGFTSC